MAEKPTWMSWGARLKAGAAEKGENIDTMAEHLGLTPAALRHWTNGTRNINLSDFFRLCEAGKCNPQQVLFGNSGFTEDDKIKIGAAVMSILEADPASNAHYAPAISRLRKAPKNK